MIIGCYFHNFAAIAAIRFLCAEPAPSTHFLKSGYNPAEVGTWVGIGKVKVLFSAFFKQMSLVCVFFAPIYPYF